MHNNSEDKDYNRRTNGRLTQINSLLPSIPERDATSEQNFNLLNNTFNEQPNLNSLNYSHDLENPSSQFTN